MSSLKQYAAKSLLTSSSVVFQTNNSMDWGGYLQEGGGIWGSELLLLHSLLGQPTAPYPLLSGSGGGWPLLQCSVEVSSQHRSKWSWLKASDATSWPS